MVEIKGDRVLVERITEPKSTSSLIEVVQLEERPSQFSRVLAVGNGKRQPKGNRNPIGVEVGQMIVTVPYCGVPVSIDGKDLHLIVEDDILGVVEGC